MTVLYDFQEIYKNIPVGEFADDEVITKRTDSAAAFHIEAVEDVKTLHISARENQEAGIIIDLSSIEGLRPGDRLTITGRVGEHENIGPRWAIALIQLDNRRGVIHEAAPKPLFALSYVLEDEDINGIFTVHGISWGATEPKMDVFIDEIIIIRTKKTADQIDTREIIYTLSEDTTLGEQVTEVYESGRKNPNILLSGEPNVRIFPRNDRPAIHISNRVNDWDGIELCLENLNLIPGNRYKVIARVQADGKVPAGTLFILMGLPGYAWRSETDVNSVDEFVLEHVMTRTEIEKWNRLCIVTNKHGSAVSFYIYEIEVRRL